MLRAGDEDLVPSDVVIDVDEPTLEATFEEETWPSDTTVPFVEADSAVDEATVLARCAATGRGVYASNFERADVDLLCRELEAKNPRKSLQGRWQLVYSSEPGLYRSSPFFWGFNKLLNNLGPSPVTLRNSKDNSYASNIYAITDGLPFYEIGNCYQTITNSSFVSEVELEIKLFDSLLPRATSVMTTTARTLETSGGLSLTLETTQVKDSSIAEALPPLFGFLSDIAFPTESAFQQLADGLSQVTPNAATVSLDAPYVSDTLRITRTDSGMLFVHVKADDDDFF